MVSKTLTVVNPSGLHLRPAGVLSQTAMKFKCDVIIEGMRCTCYTAFSI